MCIELETTYGCGHRKFVPVPCDSKKCKTEEKIPAKDKDDCMDCIQRTMRRLREERNSAKEDVRRLREERNEAEQAVKLQAAAKALFGRGRSENWKAHLGIDLEMIYACGHEVMVELGAPSGTLRFRQETSVDVPSTCPACQVNQTEQHAAAAARLQQQVEGYERDLISTIEERDDLLQRLENDGIRKVNDLREIIETIHRDNQEYEARETALEAERRERLVVMESQNAQTDTVPLDLEEKMQIAMLEYQELKANLKEKKEKNTAIPASLAFAMVRSEGTAATQDQDLANASADSDNEWWESDDECVEMAPHADDEEVALSSSSNDHPPAMPGAWAF